MVEASATASGLAPANGFHFNTLKKDLNNWWIELEMQKPAVFFPAIEIKTAGRCFPAALPAEIEHQILGRVVTANLLNDPKLEQKYWGPLRRGVKLARVPARVVAHFNADRCQVTLYD